MHASLTSVGLVGWRVPQRLESSTRVGRKPLRIGQE